MPSSRAGLAGLPRLLTAWYSRPSAALVGLWNTAHNVGGALIPMWWSAALHYGWRAGMTIAGCLAILAGLYLCWRLRDRPQAVGYPPWRLASRCAGNRPAAGRRWDVS
ncbi:regulatory protein UhpC [Klebsiella pneumoniae]|uniref:Regulatory protein UhpC n=1 Tax=Klebsiella pneumoniae TaxID=573 RepID=A0A378B6D8_KLEPN|nr:regulatory protein UhpC [Klebsiella pneumoniae]